MSENILNLFAKAHPYQLSTMVEGSIADSYSCSVREAALIGVFCKDFCVWEDGRLCINETNDTDPLAMESLSHFIDANATVRAFRIALSRNLSHLTHSESERIVEEAAKRIFPDCYEQSQKAYDQVLTQINVTGQPPSRLPKPLATSPVWLIPLNINKEDLSLLKECLTMLTKIHPTSETEADTLKWYKKALSVINKRSKKKV